MLTTALQTPEHSGRVRGVGGFVSPSIFFNLPNGKRSRITKAELLLRDRERDAELEKAKQEMALEMEKTRQKMAELMSLLDKANISSPPPVSDKSSNCEAKDVQEAAKIGVAKHLEPLMVGDDEVVPIKPFPPENKVK